MVRFMSINITAALIKTSTQLFCAIILFNCALTTTLFAQQQIVGKLKAGEQGYEVSLEVKNWKDKSIENLEVKILKQPQSLLNLKITPQTVNSLGSGEVSQFTVGFDVAHDAKPIDYAEIKFYVSADNTEFDDPLPIVALAVTGSQKFNAPVFHLVRAQTSQVKDLSKGYSSNFNHNEVGGSYRYKYDGGWGEIDYLVTAGLTKIPQKIVLGLPFEINGKIAMKVSFSEEHRCHSSKIEKLKQNQKDDCLTQGQSFQFSTYPRFIQKEIKLNPSGITDFTVKFSLQSCNVYPYGEVFPKPILCESNKGKELLETGRHSDIKYIYLATSDLKDFESEDITFEVIQTLALSTNANGFVDENLDENKLKLINLYPKNYRNLVIALEKTDDSYTPVESGNHDFSYAFKLRNQILNIEVEYKPVLAGANHLAPAQAFTFPDDLGVGKIATNNKEPSLGVKKPEGSGAIVPELTGHSAQEAAAIAKKAGFIPEFEVGEETRDPKKENVVYKQIPQRSAQLEPGSRITMLVHTIADNPTVPDVIGIVPGKASDVLIKAGLTPVFEVGKETRDRKKENIVYYQSPAPGSTIETGSDVVMKLYSFTEIVQAVKKEIPEETVTEYCSMGKSGFIYQPDHDYFIFRSREPRKITSRSYSRQYRFVPDYAEAGAKQIQQEGKMELVLKGKIPDLCFHLRENCALSTMNNADGSFFGDICGKWEDPSMIYVAQKPAAIPDFRGMTVVKAQKTLQDLNMNITVELGNAASKQNDVNIVYKQTPAPGNGVTKGGTVTVWIYGEYASANPSPETIVKGIPLITMPTSIAGVRQITSGMQLYNVDSGSKSQYLGGRVEYPDNIMKYSGYHGGRTVQNTYSGKWIRPAGGGEERDFIVLRAAWLAEGDDPSQFEKNIPKPVYSKKYEPTGGRVKYYVDRGNKRGYILILSDRNYAYVYGDCLPATTNENRIEQYCEELAASARRLFDEIEKHAKSR